MREQFLVLIDNKHNKYNSMTPSTTIQLTLMAMSPKMENMLTLFFKQNFPNQYHLTSDNPDILIADLDFFEQSQALSRFLTDNPSVPALLFSIREDKPLPHDNAIRLSKPFDAAALKTALAALAEKATLVKKPQAPTKPNNSSTTTVSTTQTAPTSVSAPAAPRVEKPLQESPRAQQTISLVQSEEIAQPNATKKAAVAIHLKPLYQHLKKRFEAQPLGTVLRVKVNGLPSFFASADHQAVKLTGLFSDLESVSRQTLSDDMILAVEHDIEVDWQDIEGEEFSYIAVLWETARWAAPASFPTDTAFRQPLIFEKHPDIRNLLDFSHAEEMATLWSQKSLTVMEMLAQNIPQQYVCRFYWAAIAAGLLTPYELSSDGAADQTLFTRLFGKKSS